MEIKVGGLYLATMACNSKKITWRPCKVIEITDDSYRVKYLEGGRLFPKQTKRLSKVKGKYELVMEDTLRPITDKWVQNEFNKIEQQRQALDAAEAVIKQCYFR